MCGICGVAFSRRSGRGVDRDALIRMRDAMVHRGPDGAGLYVGRRAGLGHRRLSIIDVAGGAQPMSSDDGHLQLVYNGEVYNHPQLHEEFVRQGVRYHTRCDTETILRLYERVGAATPERLRGMFAFAVWNEQTEELFLARDRFGVKPLYYALLDDGSIAFASEAKALFASGLVRPVLDARVLPDVLANYAPSGEETLFVGVRRLPPGHTLRWSDGQVEIRRYWDLHYGETLTGSEATLVAEYRERFTDAVRMRLMSDVPLGMFLSGGIDSAAITAVMSQLVPDPIRTFSVAFAEHDANELAYARMVAQRFGTEHREVVVTPAEFWGEVPRLVWHEDEPMAHPSSVALNFVSRLAAETVKVVLTGEGSDETLAGYNRYRVTVTNLALGGAYERALPARVRGAIRAAVLGLPARHPLRQKLLRTFLTRGSALEDVYFENFSVFDRALQQRLLAPDLWSRVSSVSPYEAAMRALGATDARSLLDRLLYADTKTYLHELLMKQDQMSMAASIESRVPFLDHPLVEFAARLPQRLKLRGWETKVVLRRAMRDLLPDPILARKKMGFPVPVGEWLRGPDQHLVSEFVLGRRASERGLFRADTVRELAVAHTAGAQNHGQRLWALVNLEIWQRIFLDGEPWSEVIMPARDSAGAHRTGTPSMARSS